MKEVDLDMHRSIDQLGKFSVNLKIDTGRNVPDQEVEAILTDILNRVGHACLDNGADMIGHIKSCAHGIDERVCSANLTSFRVGVELENKLRGDGIDSGYIMLHVIVHGLWDPQVRDISLKEIDTIMHEHGLSYRIIRDFFETEKRVRS
ncbi:MAG: hypothetical protein PHW93_05485 [Candidatus Methanomethylophilaceae archaeon]|nr:hypothetical protein [Candidatus Methanomethylophilaceae archaeon]